MVAVKDCDVNILGLIKLIHFNYLDYSSSYYYSTEERNVMKLNLESEIGKIKSSRFFGQFGYI